MDQWLRLIISKKQQNPEKAALITNERCQTTDQPGKENSGLQGLYLDNSAEDLVDSLYTEEDLFSQPASPKLAPPFDQADLAEKVGALTLSVATTTLHFLQNQLQKPIGERLLQAGLLSSAQLQIALQDQQAQPHLRLGEILLLRGWIQEQTLWFFLNLERIAAPEVIALPIGQKLKIAGLVTEEQIQRALRDQQQMNVKLVHALYLNRALSRTTADYFLHLEAK